MFFSMLCDKDFSHPFEMTKSVNREMKDVKIFYHKKHEIQN